METNNERGAVRRSASLTRRLNVSLFWIYVLSLVLTAPAVYYYTRQQLYREANEDLQLMVDMVKSIQGYVAADLRPYLTKKKIYYSPAISGIVATSRIAANLKQLQPRFYIKIASDNPLNPANGANALEFDLLERFRRAGGGEKVIAEGEMGGKLYMVAAAPKMSKKGCLRCHGKPDKAPEDVINTYGSYSGYNYKVDDVVGVSVVGVPIADVKALALERSTLVMGGLTALFGLLFLSVNLFIRRLVVAPILEITNSAHAMADGNLTWRLESKREDEIGDLAHSVEKVRRHLAGKE